MKQLQALGTYMGEVEQSEDIIVSEQFKDMVILKKLSEVKIEKTEPNIRVPFICVSKDQHTHVPLSADINCAACDNKFVAEVLGRTAAFCTACKAQASDMVGQRAHNPYFMDCGVKDAHDIWKYSCAEAFGELQTEDVALPSKKGDYESRFGAKHAPMSDSFESTKVLYCFWYYLAYYLNPDNLTDALQPSQHMELPD